MFMFRRKRNCLAKRLWKARIRREHEIRSKGEAIVEDELYENGPNCSSCCSLSDEGLLRHAVLKRLKDNQLEMLVEAVESGGAGTSTCVLVPKDLVQEPHLLCCQIWRWPDLKSTAELRRTPACSSASDPIYICCNPYHWSRLCEPESPPPPYTRFNNERLKPEDRAPSEAEIIDYELAYHHPAPPPPHHHHLHPHHHYHHHTFYRATDRFRASLSTSGGESELKENEWCKLAYWELSQRVGRLYPVQSTAVNIFWTDLQADGLSLETLAHHSFSPPESVHRNRNKIGLGITLSLEEDGVWMYNRSDWPVFVNSPSLDRPSCRTFLVYRVPAGHCFRIFYPKVLRPPPTSTYWAATATTVAGPIDPNSVRISFAKGWGPKYSRQEITACPTWLEVLLSPCR